MYLVAHCILMIWLVNLYKGKGLTYRDMHMLIKPGARHPKVGVRLVS